MMSAIELFQLATSTGVLAGGVGVLKWAFSIERRLMKIEVLTNVKG
ncbi:hypothetical protein [Herbaspirillum huttiense]